MAIYHHKVVLVGFDTDRTAEVLEVLDRYLKRLGSVAIKALMRKASEEEPVTVYKTNSYANARETAGVLAMRGAHVRILD